MAMSFVQRNIAAFGGDPGRVLIHDCSAGGVSIANHLTQPLSWPLFSSAVMASGNMLAFVDAVSMADAQASYDSLLRGLGCTSVDCLLSKNTTQLLEGNAAHAAPVVDGYALTDFPRELLRQGKVKHCSTIVGATRDELAGLEAASFAQYANMSEAGFRSWLATNYGPEHVERLLGLYPPSMVADRVGPQGGAPFPVQLVTS
jgi:carboxylesterase type B